MPHFSPVDPKQNFPELEREIIAYWEENDTFRKSIDQRPRENSYVFFDGPPFATGLPHYGHILAGTIKDVIPRFFTMRGKRIERRFGWDCHGVPVEFQVEKEMNIGGKPEIEKMGVEKYNELCRGIVLRCAADWERTVTRMGRWVDFRNDYKTMDPDYMESVWWVFKSLWDKGLIYEGEKVVAYSPKLGSPLSNFEAGLNYKDIDDPAVTVKFELEDEPGTYVLAWTTTPWTLPSNLGLTVHPDLEYWEVPKKYWKNQDKSEVSNKAERIIAGKAFCLRHFKDLEADSDLKKYKGQDLIGKKYKPLFHFFKDHKNAFQIFGDDFVSEEDGTGVVHMAPTGMDDARILQANGVELFYPFDENCYFDKTIPELEGKYFRSDSEVAGSKENNANDWVIEELKKSGKIFERQQIRHSYPHCWRTECALMYRGVKTWFVHVEKIKEAMVEHNEKIHWVPDAIGHKRFANWLENAQDWAISRNRYWGAPLPVWKCTECDQVECVGSIAELQEKGLKNSKVFVMRHGEAVYNVNGILNGDPEKIDNCLTAMGKEQVQTAAEELRGEKIDVIFASPFPRTRETAELLAAAIGFETTRIRYDDRLKEFNAGKYEGEKHESFRQLFADPKERFEQNPHDGESSRAVFERVALFLRELQADVTLSGKNILIISHGDTIRGIRHYFTHEPPEKIFNFDRCPSPGYAEIHTYAFESLPRHASGEIDLHRPYIDRVFLNCSKCNARMERVPEVLDCWFESGSMPYGQSHFPFENEEHFRKNYPADFIAEGLDQTRGWFYTLHVLATALFDSGAFKNVIVNGIVLAEDGQKMSKSKKNYPDPHEVFEKFGVDAVRFTLMNSPVVKGDDLRFSEKAVMETLKSVFLPLWNTYSFFVTYANIDQWKPTTELLDAIKSGEPYFEDEPSETVLMNETAKLDDWILSELRELIRVVTEKMEAYELFEASRQIASFLEKLTNTYIRRSRRRFWKSGMEDDKDRAFQTLYFVLINFCQVLAPFSPFLSEYIYRNLTKEESVHLTDFPGYENLPNNAELREQFALIEIIISQGLALRTAKKIKLRQPLQKAEIFLPSKFNRKILGANVGILKQELNVKAVDLMESVEKIATKIIKPNARILGPHFGTEMQQIIQEAKAGKFEEVPGGVQVAGKFLEEGSYEIEFLSKEGLDVSSENGIVVALDMTITEELQQEGYVRELIRFVQDARKEAGYDVADRINLGISGAEELLSVFQKYGGEIASEVLAEEVLFGEKLQTADLEKAVMIENEELQLSLARRKLSAEQFSKQG